MNVLKKCSFVLKFSCVLEGQKGQKCERVLYHLWLTQKPPHPSLSTQPTHESRITSFDMSPTMSCAPSCSSGSPPLLPNPPTEFQLTGNWLVDVLVILQWHWFLLGCWCTAEDLIPCVAVASRLQWDSSSIWASGRASSPLKRARAGPPICGK